MRIRLGAALLATALGAAGCNLDLENPNDPTEQEVITDANGILALAVGLQGQYAASVIDYARAPALVTDQWGPAARALLADQSLFTGVDVLPDYGVVTDPYVATYRIARTANLLIEQAPQVGSNRGVKVGAVALAKLFKAMALGNAALQFERLPANAVFEGAAPLPRDVALDTVIALLESARSDLATVTDAELGVTFNSRVLGSGINLRSTTNAMLARYYLFDGQYQQAIDAANRVDLTKLSVLTYPNPNVNPIFTYSFGDAVYVGALKSFVDQAEPGDRRPAFWVDVTATPVPARITNARLLPFRAFAERNDPIPLYLPDEMRLIKAEAFTRLGQFEQARAQINAVRTQTTGSALEPVAGLPALPVEALDTEAELFRQIAYERQYELYWVGTRWSDLRRLDPFVSTEPSIQFLPFPLRECQVNPNSGC
jgi:hypothetical protein